MVPNPGLTSIGGEHSAQGYILTIGATTAEDQMVWRNNTGATVTITKAAYTPDTAVTGAATNNMTLQFLSRVVAGTAKLAVTAIKTYASGTDIAQFAEDSLVLSTTAANLVVLDGESIILQKAENGTGLALPAGIATLEFRFEG